MSNKNADYYFLKGGGEMGELIRAKDWSETSLGDPSTWPQSLCTMVAVMLHNPFGMYIAWGSEFIQLYNDGYRPILGATKHPQALGISTRETFSEIWENIIGSMFDDVMKGKAVGFPDLMLPLNRNGFVEECYFDFSYSPILKNDGEVGGVLVTVIETTEKKKAQAALLESSTQLKFAMDAAELGTWDYNPATNKFTANGLLKTWFGLSASEEIELHHATDAIAEKDRERIIMAIKKVLDYSSGGIYEEEYSIINPLTNKEIIVHGKGRAWFNDEKIPYRFNGILQEVTENVLARKKTEESEEQLRIAIEGGEFGTFDFFPRTNQLIWSGKTKELFGLPTDAQVDYDTYLAALHPEDRGTSRAIAQQQADLKEEGLYELEYRTIGITDGKLRWLRSKGKATYNKEGEAIRYTGVIQDITEQKKSAEKVRESNERFRNTMKQAPVGIAILRGLQYTVEMANNAYLQLVDKKEDEFVGNPLFETLPEVEEAVHALLDSVLNTGVPYRGNEVPIPVNRYGKQEVFYFDFLYHPLKENDGKISGVIAIVTEVTEKVETRKKIEESEQRFQAAVEAVEGILWTNNGKGEMEGEQPGWASLTGQTYEEYQGYGWARAIHPDDVQPTLDAWNEAVQERKIFIFEHRVKTKDEGYKYFSIRAIPLLNPDGSLRQWVGVHSDIQDQKTREEKKDEFISIASHELKTPLTTAKAYLQMLELLLDENNEDASLYAKKANQSVNRLNELISELLDVSKIRLGKLNYTVTTFNFNEMIESTVENIQLTSLTHSIVKTGQVNDTVTGDKDRLQQVVINLLTNAIKYSPDAEKVFINLAQEKDIITVTVKDAGIGIARQSLDKIFEKYHRVEEHAVHFQGLGIGLFISYEIIQRHNGRLWAQSNPGKGSTFYFTIPVKQ